MLYSTTKLLNVVLRASLIGFPFYVFSRQAFKIGLVVYKKITIVFVFNGKNKIFNTTTIREPYLYYQVRLDPNFIKVCPSVWGNTERNTLRTHENSLFFLVEITYISLCVLVYLHFTLIKY